MRWVYLCGLLATVGARAADGPVVDAAGVLVRDGRPYRAIGVNYFSAFGKLLANPDDPTVEAAFAELEARQIPFARISACGFWPSDWKLYRTDPTAYFRRLDRLVQTAERHQIGLIPSLFWNCWSICDVVGEPFDQYGNRDSQTHALIRQYTREVVSRYLDSPAIWAWEFGNELNLAADLPNAKEHRPRILPHLGTPTTRSERDELSHAMLATAISAWAAEVRQLDPRRPLSAGHSIPRPSAWHQRAEQSWQKDDPDQARQIFAEQNPDPVNLLSIHVYDEAQQRLPQYAEFAKVLRKPLFVGEFGVPGDPPAGQAEFATLLQAVETSGAALAAVWVYDRAKDPYNLVAGGPRAYQLDALQAANQRLSAAR